MRLVLIEPWNVPSHHRLMRAETMWHITRGSLPDSFDVGFALWIRPPRALDVYPVHRSVVTLAPGAIERFTKAPIEAADASLATATRVRPLPSSAATKICCLEVPRPLTLPLLPT